MYLLQNKSQYAVDIINNSVGLAAFSWIPAVLKRIFQVN